MRIILDFDHTLFSSPRLKEAIKDIFMAHGVPSDLFEETREASRGTGLDWKPDIQLLMLRDQGISGTELIRRKLWNLLKKSSIFLYEDTIPFLKKAAHSHSCALLTYGEDSFQNAKVDGCKDMKKHLDEIVITQNIYKDKEAKELAHGKPALFVEDNPLALSAAKKLAQNIVTVRMKRGEGRYVNEASGEGIDYEVKGLTEVEKILLIQNSKVKIQNYKQKSKTKIRF